MLTKQQEEQLGGYVYTKGKLEEIFGLKEISAQDLGSDVKRFIANIENSGEVYSPAVFMNSSSTLYIFSTYKQASKDPNSKSRTIYNWNYAIREVKKSE